MKTVSEKQAVIDELRGDISRSQKKGLHFIMTAVTTWALYTLINFLPLSLGTRNILCVICAALFAFFAQIYARLIRVKFSDPSEPLMTLALMIALAQMLYIPISVWAFYVYPEKMLMMIAIVSGAHLLPFAWLYRSKAYLIFSILIPLIAIVIGWLYPPSVLAPVMLPVSALFCTLLYLEVKKLHTD
ncbi:MAG: hypothetical protein IKS90_01725 [Clostridia bacterium]|nr:hypothetical protein [Clostridia bacterium]